MVDVNCEAHRITHLVEVLEMRLVDVDRLSFEGRVIGFDKCIFHLAILMVIHELLHFSVVEILNLALNGVNLRIPYKPERGLKLLDLPGRSVH